MGSSAGIPRAQENDLLIVLVLSKNQNDASCKIDYTKYYLNERILLYLLIVILCFRNILSSVTRVL